MNLVEFRAQVLHGDFSKAKGAGVLRRVKAGYLEGSRQDHAHATTKQWAKKHESKAWKTGYHLSTPEAFAMEHKGATTAALASGTASAGTGVVLGQRKKG